MNKFLIAFCVTNLLFTHLSFSQTGPPDEVYTDINGLNNEYFLNNLSQFVDGGTLLIEYEAESEDVVIEIYNQLFQQGIVQQLYQTPILFTRCWEFSKWDFSFEINGVEYTSQTQIEANENIKRSRGNLQTAGNNDGLNFKSRINYLPGGEYASPKFPCSDIYRYFFYLGQEPVNVSILDSGIKTLDEGGGFPDYPFNISIVSEKNYIPNNSEISGIALDENGHGTHVTSVLNAIATSQESTANALSYDIRKILNEKGQGNLGHVLYAAEEAILANAQIINMSFGYEAVNTTNSLIIALFDLLEASNVLTIVSAGNKKWDLGENIYMPAGLQGPNIITVGNIECRSHKKAESSNFNPFLVDIATVGLNIPGYDHNGNLVLKSGTSQSAAIVGGVAIMLASHMQQFDAAQVKCAITSGAMKIQALFPYFQNGNLLDAWDAYTELNIANCDHGGEPDDPEDTPDQIDLRSFNKNVISLETYPNPFNAEFTLKFNGNMSDVFISDAIGNIVFKDTYKINHDLNSLLISEANYWKSGIYFINVIDEFGNQMTRRVIKQ